jgi:hypothetical protein
MLMRWHYRLGQLNYNSLQFVLKSGALGFGPVAKTASRCKHPKCASCAFGKAKSRSTTAEASHHQ